MKITDRIPKVKKHKIEKGRTIEQQRFLNKLKELGIIK